MPAEMKPLGSFPKTEANTNSKFKNMSLEELRALVQWPSKMEEAQDEPGAQFVPVPEEPAVEPDEPEPEVQPEPEPVEPETPTQQAEPEQQQKTSEKSDDEDVEKQLLMAKLEAMEAHAKKIEAKLIGREAGERGYIKQLQREIEKLKSVKPEDAEQDAYPEEYPTEKKRVPSRASERDSIASWAVGRAIAESAAAFTQGHPDSSELQPDIQRYLQESGYDASNVLQSDDPIWAGKEISRALEEAYWHVKESKKRTVVEELQKRRADSMRGVEDAKRKATISASGSSAPPKPKPKTVQDLTTKELRERVNKLASRR